MPLSKTHPWCKQCYNKAQCDTVMLLFILLGKMQHCDGNFCYTTLQCPLHCIEALFYMWRQLLCTFFNFKAHCCLVFVWLRQNTPILLDTFYLSKHNAGLLWYLQMNACTKLCGIGILLSAKTGTMQCCSAAVLQCCNLALIIGQLFLSLLKLRE